MNSLSRFFERYTGTLRGLKLSYFINNLLHWRALGRNKSIYAKAGLRKSVYAPIGYADLRDKPLGDVPWLDRPDALTALAAHPDFGGFDTRMQIELRRFVTDGYMILEDFVPQEQVAALNAEVQARLTQGAAGFNYTGRKIVDLHNDSTLADEQFFRNPRLVRLFEFVMQKEVVPFQSLNFIQGSEQRPHSDSIHMMTAPEGYMIAAWYALEDCTTDNGPLVYYPGSHRLPYLTTLDYPSGNTVFTIGAESNTRYEEKVAEVIASSGIEPRYFYAKAGSVLVWHANLIHGGSPIKQMGSTRMSMVCHYYCSDVICYHEMSQRPAIFPSQR